MNAKTKGKLYKKIGKLLDFREQPMSIRKFKKNTMLLSADRIVGFAPNNIETKKILLDFSSEDDLREMDIIMNKKYELKESSIDLDYLHKVIDIFKELGSVSVKIKHERGQPIFIEDDNLLVAIAPRVED